MHEVVGKLMRVRVTNDPERPDLGAASEMTRRNGHLDAVSPVDLGRNLRATGMTGAKASGAAMR